jgi:hypothetical protein
VHEILTTLQSITHLKATSN